MIWQLDLRTPAIFGTQGVAFSWTMALPNGLLFHAVLRLSTNTLDCGSHGFRFAVSKVGFAQLFTPLIEQST